MTPHDENDTSVPGGLSTSWERWGYVLGGVGCLYVTCLYPLRLYFLRWGFVFEDLVAAQPFSAGEHIGMGLVGWGVLRGMRRGTFGDVPTWTTLPCLHFLGALYRDLDLCHRDDVRRWRLVCAKFGPGHRDPRPPLSDSAIRREDGIRTLVVGFVSAPVETIEFQSR